MNKKLISQVMILWLVALSAGVFVGQLRHDNVWPFICAYWLMVTLKNFVDLLMSK